MRVEFRLLGEISVHVDGRPLEIGYAQLRCMLAVLLVESDRPVSADQLVERVWGGRELPLRPRAAIHHNMAVLRRALAPAGDVAIVRHPAGYLLTADAETVDLHRFGSLLKRARAAQDDERAAELFEQALRLWRGEAFGGLDTPWLNARRDTLESELHAARLDLTDIQLRRGRHAALLGDLLKQTAQYPLDERLAGQYLLALYRGGLQADALRYYETLRLRLADELGTDPSPPSRKLHQRILAADPALGAPASPVAVTSAPIAAPAPSAPLPRQLPAPPRQFTGRTRELAYLTAALDGQPGSGGTLVVTAIGGTGGIGKTWLALHWAYQHLDRFPDGQLYVDLRGFDPGGQAVRPATVVRGFLDALGVAPRAVPADLDAQVELFRSLVADRHMLIVLDNARDSEQIAPLLPNGPTCTVLVTSRRRLSGPTGAHGARTLDLDVLPDDDARHLLISHLGHERVAAESEAVTDLIASCAGLPLAIGIVGARATRYAHAQLPLSTLAAELRDQAHRLDALDAGDARADLSAVLSWSYDALSPKAATASGLLAMAPGPDISLAAAASLLALPVAEARVLIRELEDASLIHEHAPGRFRTHDLVRLYAATRAAQDQPAPERQAALRRVVDFYLHTADAGHRLLNPQAAPRELDPPAVGCEPLRLDDDTAAMAWFDAEYPCLPAAQEAAAEQGWHRAVWHLAWALEIYHQRRGRLHECVAVWRTALVSADHLADHSAGDLADPTTRIVAHRFLGRALARTGRDDEALEHLSQALALADDAGDRLEQAHTHRALAVVLERRGEVRPALEHATDALRLFHDLGKQVWEADALNAVGWCAMRLGEYDRAREHCQAALALHRRLGNPVGEASTLDSLGYIAHHRGDQVEAVERYQEALALMRSLGNDYEEANTLDRLGEPYAALGQKDQARAVWEAALTLYETQGRDADVAQVRRQLDALDERPPIGRSGFTEVDPVEDSGSS
jgi:DNA-binding SARP family transcriptional activator/tetratricopeptide (TPR) repeat protein